MKASTTPTRLWWTEVSRGTVTLTFGLLYLTLQNLIYALIYTLGTYLLCDGVLDLYRSIAGKRVPQRYFHAYLGGFASVIIGLISLIRPVVTLFLSGIVVAVRIILRGFQVIGEVRSAQENNSGFRWLYATLLILGGIALLLPPVLTLTTRLLVIFVGLYALGDGLYLLVRGLRFCFAPSTFVALIHRATKEQLDIPALSPSTTRRALIFVRRSGAAGLGHIGWAFEWHNGWFNTGGIENRGFYAFAPPERADFWTAHTVDPLTTMQKFGEGYDEFKIFYTDQPHPKEAWGIVVWISRLPYRVIRRNCVDATYDVLRTYGLTNLPDPATAYAPNDWYDALSGPSYALAINPAIPVNIRRHSQRTPASGEIFLTIPSHIAGTTPPWREIGLRGLTEICTSGAKMVSDVRASFVLLGRFMTKCWKYWKKMRPMKSLRD